LSGHPPKLPTMRERMRIISFCQCNLDEFRLHSIEFLFRQVFQVDQAISSQHERRASRSCGSRPETDATSLPAAALQFADAMHEIECFEQCRRHRHGAIEAGAALLQALEHQHAGGEVDTIDVSASASERREPS
jgi:hypothetical protein